MREILTIFLIAALLTVALKVALILLILAGLIFRTRETVGLIVILAIFAHPGIGFTIVAVIVAIAVYRSVSEPPDEPSGPD